MASDAFFSNTYAEARRRFVDAARAAGATLRAYAIDAASADKLTIDVAILGADHSPAVVVSSGVHGVEGYFGSAVQLALLERLKDARERKNIRYVLIHGVNPYGFAHSRRVNEDNVDLNRNFMTNHNAYVGAPAGYARLDGFLNPQSPPSRLEPFKLRALWNIWRVGLQPLKEAVAGGQYEFPQGLFFGGKAPSASTRIVQNNCDAWLAASQPVLHIDLHTGLGANGGYKLLLNEAVDSAHYAWYAATFGAESIEPLTQRDGTAYRVSGPFGLWMQHHFQARDYRYRYHFVGAEFGTYDVIRVLGAMRAENRAHYYCSRNSPAYQRAQQAFRECFCPASPAWRTRVVESGLRIIEQGAHAIAARAL